MRLAKAFSCLLVSVSVTFRAIADRLNAETDLLVLRRFEESTQFVKSTVDDARRVTGKAPLFHREVAKQRTDNTRGPHHFDDEPPAPPAVPVGAPKADVSPEELDDDHDRAFAILGDIPWPGLAKMAAAYVRETGGVFDPQPVAS